MTMPAKVRPVVVAVWCLALAWLASSCSLAPVFQPSPDERVGASADAATTALRVVDPDGAPVAGAQVYLSGCSPGAIDCAPLITDAQGEAQVSADRLGAAPVALALQETVAASPQPASGSWSYRVYLTNLQWSADGDPQPVVMGQDGMVELRLQRLHPLILFDLAVSLDWTASEAYLQTLTAALHAASDYLFDLTDGQAAFGLFDVYDDKQHWAEADIHIQRKNDVCPYSTIGVVTGEASQGSIELGPYWDGDHVSGDWSQPNGYRAITHEFMHYAFGLYDEYIDKAGQEVYCTEPAAQLPPLAADQQVSASAMYHEERATELSALNVPYLWTDACQNTLQWQVTGESAWQTIALVYADGMQPPRWIIDTPMRRGHAMAGPDPTLGQWPTALPRWPTIDRHTSEAPPTSEPKIRVQTTCQDVQTSVKLYPGGASTPFALGSAPIGTDFVLLGAQPGDVACISAWKPGASECTAGSAFAIANHDLGVTRVISLTDPSCEMDDLLHPAAIHPPPAHGGKAAQPPAPVAPRLAGLQPGVIDLVAVAPGSVSAPFSYDLAGGTAGLAEWLQAAQLPGRLPGSAVNGQLYTVKPLWNSFVAVDEGPLGEFAIQTVEPGQSGELTVGNGQISLLVNREPTSLENVMAVLVQPQRGPETPLPANMQSLGEVTFSNGAAENAPAAGHAVMTLNCVPRPPAAVAPPGAPTARPALARLNEDIGRWEALPVTYIASANVLTAPIDLAGYYVFVQLLDP